MKVTKEDILSIIRKVECRYCENYVDNNGINECEECSLYEYEYFSPNQDFIDKINKLLEEK